MPLEGKLVILREEHREDQKLFADLRNDLATQAWGRSLPPDYTEEMHIKRFEGLEFSVDRTSGRFVIVEKASGQAAGFVTYTGEQRRFSTTIGIVVARPFWGTGVAFDALETLLRFLFDELGLREVHLWTHTGLPKAIGLAERSGFAVCIRLREAVFKFGNLFDSVIMSLLREDYYARHPEMHDRMPPVELGTGSGHG
jgi:RimJ/RimL family protein N-acetyltransferase